MPFEAAWMELRAFCQEKQVRERQDYIPLICGNLKKSITKLRGKEIRFVVTTDGEGREGGESDEGGHKIQNSSYK